ncbi:MAG TPA: adenosine deaminase [Candidatus Krumholzibacteria bacterium]|nr:adenosine deaminase [Candidatus Krumholzibacteria bacterium]HRX49952.1 adenosine deaminase [Candidatus Krumholzibacteria bacterium]
MSLSGYRPSDRLRGRRIPDALLRDLPKTDLLFHLDGSLRPGTYAELARAAGEDVPDDAAALRRHVMGGAARPSPHFAECFRRTVPLLQTADALRRVAREAAEDAHACGVWAMEVRFCPVKHLGAGLDADGAVAAVRAGLDEAETSTGIRAGIIVTGVRTIGPDTSLELAELAVRWRGRGVVAFDLAGEEKDYPAKDHRRAFYHLMNHNVPSTIHAGEGFGPESIHQALHRCGANRIGHGVTLHQDPELLAWVNDRRIPVELALSSNVATGVVPSAGEHPLRRYLDAGLRVSLNTDNTLLVDTDQVRELRRAVDTFDLTLLEAETLLLNGFKSSFLPQREKAELTARAAARFRELRDLHRLDSEETA